MPAWLVFSEQAVLPLLLIVLYQVFNMDFGLTDEFAFIVESDLHKTSPVNIGLDSMIDGIEIRPLRVLPPSVRFRAFD